MSILHTFGEGKTLQTRREQLRRKKQKHGEEKPSPIRQDLGRSISASPNMYKNDTLKKENDSVDQSDEHSTCVFDSTFAKEK